MPPSLSRQKATSNLNFLTANSEVAALMRKHDWTNSPLGEPASWPLSLKVVVNLILNSKFPMFVAWGPELGFLYNDAYADILGDKHPLSLGRSFQDIWPEIWNDIDPLIRRAMRGESTYHENLPLLMRRNGYDEQTWFTFSYSPVQDDNGNIAGMYCACTETTQQVLAERHRVEENERLRQLFQQAPGIMAVVREPTHIFELVNDAYLQLVGERDLIGKPVREALPEIEGQGFFELLDRVFATGEPFVGRAAPVKLRRRHDGELEERFVDFVYQPTRDYSGKVNGIFVEGSDVTEAVRAMNALRESEQRLRQLANTIPHLAWMANPDGWVHWFNDRWYDYTGTTLKDMEGWGWQSVHDPERLPGTMESWKASLSTGTPFEGTFPLRAANGQYRMFYTLAAPLRDASGAIVQWFGTNTDVTEIETARNGLKEANRRKDEFLAMLAHELRNPLAPISTAAQLLKLLSHDKLQVQKASDIITRQVEHMVDLVDDLLDVSRVTRGLVHLKKEELDLKSTVRNAIEQVRPLIESRRHTLTTWMDPAQVFVHADRTRLTQVVSNVLHNAAKYTPEGGQITLRVEVVNGQVRISVHDNGIGMDAALLPHVFDLFTQARRTPDRSQGGLGIGLALVRSIMELHEGAAEAHSAGAGKGSTFTLSLPLVQTRKIRPAMQVEAKSGSDVTPLRILIVDDNLDAAESLAVLLKAEGHQVKVASDAKSALCKAQVNPPQVFILDIGLPDLDGYALARRLREFPELAQATLIALTGYGQDQDRALSKAAGFDYHFVKPINTEQLKAILCRVQQP